MKKENLLIAVTGASGFIGKHLIDLLQHSTHRVKLISRNLNYVLPDEISKEKFEIVQADLTDVESLRRAFFGVDIIINLAAEVRNYEKVFDTNVSGTKNLVQAVVENKVAKIIHLSSVGVIGLSFSANQRMVAENEICKPMNDYEKTKYESEKILKQAAALNKFNLVVLRPTNVFGEQHPFNALLHLMKFIKSGKPVLTTKNAWVNYVYVGDLAYVINQFINAEVKNEIYHVGESMLLGTLYDEMFRLLKKKPKKIYLPPLICKVLRMAGIKKFNAISNGVRYNDDKLKTLFSYHYGLVNGLQKTFDFYSKNHLI